MLNSVFYDRPAMTRSERWEEAIAKFDSWEKVGEAEDGSPIRRHFYWGDGVREPSGYVCSPIAYSVRLKTGR